jgi:hypothetical protein
MLFTDTQLAIAFGALLLMILWLVMRLCSVKVYRFHRPNCGYCKSSQVEWDRFKSSCVFKMIRPIDINMDTASAEQIKLADNFSVSGVPNVVAVYDDGFRIKHTGSRTSADYHEWLENKGVVSPVV